MVKWQRRTIARLKKNGGILFVGMADYLFTFNYKIDDKPRKRTTFAALTWEFPIISQRNVTRDSGLRLANSKSEAIDN